MSIRASMDSFGRTRIHNLIIDDPTENHRESIVRALQDGVDVNFQDTNGWTALHFSAQRRSLLAVKTLLESGAEVDLLDSFGNTPLFRAVFCSEGEGEIIELLLSAGANPDFDNNHGVSPRKLANTISSYDLKRYFE